MLNVFQSRDDFLMWRGCDEHCPYSPRDSCEGHSSPSEGSRCGCYGTASLGKHPPSFHHGEEIITETPDNHPALIRSVNPPCLHLVLPWPKGTEQPPQQPLLPGVSAYGPVTSSGRDPEGNAVTGGLQASAIYSPCKLNTEQTKPNVAAR